MATEKDLKTIEQELARRREEHSGGKAGKRFFRRVLRSFVLLVALVFFVLSGIFLVNFIRLSGNIEGHIKNNVIPGLSTMFPLNVGKVGGDLLSGIELHDLFVQNPHFKTGGVMVNVTLVSLKYSLFDIFWGNLVLEKVLIVDPVVFLSRNSDGRAIWDFGTASGTGSAAPSSPGMASEAVDAQAKADAMTDRYLRRLEIRNLSLMIPKPRDLLPDQTMAKMLRIPPGNFQRGGINVLVRKDMFPGYSAHTMTVSTPKNPKIAQLQWNRQKVSGDYDFGVSGFNQKLICVVHNVGSSGRRIQFYDEHKKERFNLLFNLARQGESIMNRIVGVQGQFALEDLGVLQGLLPENSVLKGKVHFSANGKDDKTPLLETNIIGQVADVSLNIPDAVNVSSMAVDFTLVDRVAQVRRMEMDFGGIHSSHFGSLQFHSLGLITGSFSSDLGGEKMNLSGAMEKKSDAVKQFSFQASRDAGLLNFTAIQEKVFGTNRYRDISATALVKAGKLVSDIVPARLFPPELGKKWTAWVSRVDVVGPVEIVGLVPSPQEPGNASATVSFKGATIISKEDPKDRVLLDGTMTIASNSCEIKDLGATIDTLKLSVSGGFRADAAMKKLDRYSFMVSGALVDGKPLVLTGKRLQKTLGLAHPLPFDSLTLEGGQVLNGLISSESPEQRVTLEASKFRVKRGLKTWWVDDLKAAVSTPQRLDLCRLRPEQLDLTAGLRLFGFPVKASARVNVASQALPAFEASAQGSEFNVLVTAMKEHPTVDDFFKRWGVALNGAFSLSVKGHGKLNRPALSGKIDFPSLSLKLKDFTAILPFNLDLSSSQEGEYKGDVTTKNAKFSVKGVEFGLEKFKGALSYGKPKASKENAVTISASSDIFGTDLQARGVFFPKSQRVEGVVVKAKSSKIQTLAGEIAKFAKFQLPFNLKGNLESEIKMSGTTKTLKSNGFLELGDLSVKFPLKDKAGNTGSFDVENLQGKVQFTQVGEEKFDAEISNAKASILGAPVTLEGKAHLEKEKGALVPVLDDLGASVVDVSAAAIHKFLSTGIVPKEYTAPFDQVGGKLTGKISLSGSKNRYSGQGEVLVTGGAFRYSGLREPVKNVSGKLVFARRKENPEPRIDLSGFTASFGKSRISIPSGQIIDPQKSGKIAVSGGVDSVYPSDVMALLSSLQLPALSFPKEGPFVGKVQVSGTLAKPKIDMNIEGAETDVCYQSEGTKYVVPLGKSSVGFSYDLSSGQIHVPQCLLRFLKGELNLKEASGRIVSGRPQAFKLAGSFDQIDLGSVTIPGKSSLKGILGGEFSAEQNDRNSREALFQLRLKNLVVGNIPIDPAAIDKIGLEFLEEPEFAVGKINLYVSSEGDITEKGKLRVADGLFAGPDMRVEISDSSFDPKNLQLAAKVVFNPQPLRRTKLGKKLGNLTRVLQDKATGCPYVDLNVSGSWDNPGLMTQKIMSQNKSRGKRNFIKSIFGGRRSHKASVEELKEWFPGWTPGG